MNADMEAAQVLGAGKSIMKTHDPNFSNIHVDLTVTIILFHWQLLSHLTGITIN
jgi:hypothetical protein